MLMVMVKMRILAAASGSSAFHDAAVVDVLDEENLGSGSRRARFCISKSSRLRAARACAALFMRPFRRLFPALPSLLSPSPLLSFVLISLFVCCSLFPVPCCQSLRRRIFALLDRGWHLLLFLGNHRLLWSKPYKSSVPCVAKRIFHQPVFQRWKLIAPVFLPVSAEMARLPASVLNLSQFIIHSNSERLKGPVAGYELSPFIVMGRGRYDRSHSAVAAYRPGLD